MDTSPTADSSPSTTISSSTESVQETRSFTQPVLKRSGSLVISDAGNVKGSITSPNTDDDDCEENLPQISNSTTINVEAATAGIDCSAETEHGTSGVQLLKGKGKGKKWTAPAAEKGSKQLLDLPVDVLREIINQLPHTNDLTSLALCHSALHALTIPYIYARFDIVWPDSGTQTDPRSGVDALTYGLATLVMAEQIFGESQQRNIHSGRPTRARRGNRYAEFTRKFSLGNGPTDLVQEYLISKEGGKMLGTLVALAIARMRVLETFVWDMPTGVIRDVWLALSSLADRGDGQECRLEKVWVRWHENLQLGSVLATPPPPPPLPLNNMPLPPPPPPPAPPALAAASTTSGHQPQPNLTSSSSNYQSMTSTTLFDRIEQPTFSVLPPLKSLSVIDIDELAYLDEMSILIGKSLDRLRVLRVGIAQHAQQRNWVTPWEGGGVQQVDYGSQSAAASKIGEKRLGGVLGILVGRIHDIRDNIISSQSVPEDVSRIDLKETLHSVASAACHQPIGQLNNKGLDNPNFQQGNDISVLKQLLDNYQSKEGDDDVSEASMHTAEDDLTGSIADTGRSSKYGKAWIGSPQSPKEVLNKPSLGQGKCETRLDKKLQLETLELERVALSVSTLQRAFDWSTLTNLSLFSCANHEQLWRLLRRKFSPDEDAKCGVISKSNKSLSQAKGYKLKIQKIHTNTVSPALISFLKETLAPNSLEVLFLQESRSYQSPVTIDSIFRGPIKRHRSSLKKLLIDSSDKPSGVHGNGNRWRKWMLNREVLTFITSGRLAKLRELGVSLEYRDWHFFLQRLPLVPQIRSLYIPHVADHIRGSNNDPKELALQIVDIVALRPEIEICYMGISNKCFEILESSKSQAADSLHDGVFNAGTGSNYAVGIVVGAGSTVGGGVGGDGTVGPVHAVGPPQPVGDNVILLHDDDENENDDDDDNDDTDDSSDENNDDIDGGAANSDDGWADGNDDDNTESDDEPFYNEQDSRMPRLRLREILFYDDKVAVFKARHGTI